MRITDNKISISSFLTRSILEPLAALKSEGHTGDPEHAYGEKSCKKRKSRFKLIFKSIKKIIT